MRKAFANSIIKISQDPSVFFLTNDLGFMALEDVRESFGDRFVNAGVAEQNMIGVAAGLAREGYKVFAYSIAPFVYARPFEQIRNDVCLTNLPVCLVGNGGGYGYGHMGPTHHALEDCAAMNAIGVRPLVPCFDEDLDSLIQSVNSPAYLRLGYDCRPENSVLPTFLPWRRILSGHRGAVAALGPLAGLAWSAFECLPEEERPSVWAVTELSLSVIPDQFWKEIQSSVLVVLEEHICAGGLGMNLSYEMLKLHVQPAQFVHRYAIGYPTKTYGSQNFHRRQCGLDLESIRSIFNK